MKKRLIRTAKDTICLAATRSWYEGIQKRMGGNKNNRTWNFYERGNDGLMKNMIHIWFLH
jgi:hypothetical protein